MKIKIHGKTYIISDNADLRNADLSSADLGDAKLHNANLTYADLSSVDLHYANLSYADLSCADLSNADLRSADLRNANLTYADLSCVDLHYANLSYADLSNADLSSANLRCANLSYASLRGANLCGAKGYKNIHSIFQELCSQCDNDFFTIAEWGQIATIVLKQWCWNKIISWQPVLASSVFWKLRGKGWVEFYDEFLLQGGVHCENDILEHHTTII